MLKLPIEIGPCNILLIMNSTQIRNNLSFSLDHCNVPFGTLPKKDKISLSLYAMIDKATAKMIEKIENLSPVLVDRKDIAELIKEELLPHSSSLRNNSKEKVFVVFNKAENMLYIYDPVFRSIYVYGGDGGTLSHRIYTIILRTIAHTYLSFVYDHVHLHVAGVKMGSKGLILLGDEYSNKSSIVAHLIKDGCQYISSNDSCISKNLEIVGIPDGLVFDEELISHFTAHQEYPYILKTPSNLARKYLVLNVSKVFGEQSIYQKAPKLSAALLINPPKSGIATKINKITDKDKMRFCYNKYALYDKLSTWLLSFIYNSGKANAEREKHVKEIIPKRIDEIINSVPMFEIIQSEDMNKTIKEIKSLVAY